MNKVLLLVSLSLVSVAQASEKVLSSKYDVKGISEKAYEQKRQARINSILANITPAEKKSSTDTHEAQRHLEALERRIKTKPNGPTDRDYAQLEKYRNFVAHAASQRVIILD